MVGLLRFVLRPSERGISITDDCIMMAWDAAGKQTLARRSVRSLLQWPRLATGRVAWGPDPRLRLPLVRQARHSRFGTAST